MPSRAFTGKDGDTAYAPIVEFANREVVEEFREAVLLAIDNRAGAQKPTAAPKAGQPRAQIRDEDIPF